MKLFIAVSCVLAVASAQLVYPHGIILQDQHLPILNVDGTPVEPLPNVLARQQHASAHLNAQLRNGDALAYGPIVTSSGVPAELPANQIARAQHAAAHLDAKLRNGDAVLLARKRRSLVYAAVPQHLPILDVSGVPVEPIENQVARVQHANAHVHAQLRNGDVALYYNHAVPIVSAAGVPAELPENQIARAQHAAAHLEANLRNGNAVLLARKRRSLVYAAVPQHLPILDISGVPVEPIENQVARVQHANAHAHAQLRNGDVTPYYTHVVPIVSETGVPAELPANQIARAQHAAAHLEANLRNGNAVLLARKRRSLVYAAQHIPTLDVSGVPVEPIENQVARVQHANAYLDAQLRNGDVALTSAHPILSTPYAATYAAVASPLVSSHHIVAPLTQITHNGNVPLDTPEVAAAKAAHLATKSAIYV